MALAAVGGFVPRSFGLWRAVVRRARADRGIVGAAGLLLLVSATLLATAVVYGDAVSVGGLRRVLAAAPPADRRLVVALTTPPADVAELDGVVGPEVARTLGAPGGEVDLILRSGAFAPPGTPTSDTSALVTLAAYEGLDRHATLASGRWPEAGAEPVEATISDGAARALGLGVGDAITLEGRVDPTRARIEVVGTWHPDASDPYWTGSGELDGVETTASFTTRGPFVLATGDLLAAGLRSLSAEWRAIPAVERLGPSDVPALRRDVASLQDRLAASLPGRGLGVTTGLPDVLATVDRAILVARSGVVLLTIQFAVLAGYAILLVGGMVVDRRRAEIAILRSRGTSTAHLAAMSAAEGLLLAVPAAILAPILAVSIVRLLDSYGPVAGTGIVSEVPLGASAVGVAVLAALAGVLVLTLPVLVAGTNPGAARAARGRQTGRPLARRLGIDLALVALAALAIWQLRFYGSTLTADARGVLGIDPLLVAAPALGLLAGAILATRLLPRLAEVGERALGRRRGLVPSLGARQLARRPLRYTRAALLLMLAAALGTFAAAYGATWRGSQADQAAYAAVTDVRVTVADYPDLPDWGTASTYRAIDGVRSVVPVVRGTVDVGRALRGGQLLAVDPVAAGSLATDSGGLAGAPTALLARLAPSPTDRGVALPGTPTGITVVVDADLTAAPPPTSEPIDPAWQGLTVAAVLEDADGRLIRMTGETAAFVGAGQRIPIALIETIGGRSVTPAYPLRLRGLELAISPPAGTIAVGAVEVRGLDVGGPAAGATRGGEAEPGSAALDLGAMTSDWRWVRVDGEGSRPYRPPASAPGRIEIGKGSGIARPLYSSGFTAPAVFRWWEPSALGGELRAVASDSFLAATGSGVGDAVGATIAGLPVTLRIAASADEFPPLDPSRPFVVVPQQALEATTYAATGQTLEATEWWVATDPGRSESVAAVLARRPFSAAAVVSRDGLERSLSADPVPLGVVGALGLGALAAVAFAAIGFVVSAVTSAGERVGEFALLRAVGLSPGGLSAWLALENAVLLGFGVLAGSLVGLALAWLILPVATVTAAGTPAVPAPSVVVPLEAIGLLYAGALVLLLVTVWSVARRASRVAIGRVIREGEV